MFVKISDLARGRRHLDFEIEPDALLEAIGRRPDVEPDLTAAVEADAEEVDRTINITGKVTLRIKAVCSRCAEDYETVMVLPWNLILVPVSERPGPQIDDEGFGYYSGERIDAGQFALEHVGLVFPEILLCRPDCKGICPGCRVNLNEEVCRCK